MLEQVESALNRRDYRAARNLIKTLVHNQPNNDWVHFYAAKLQEATEHLDNAEIIYKKLLQDSINPKILKESRLGLQRIETARTEQRQASLAAALAIEGSDELGVLILEPMDADTRTLMAPKLAQIMQIDPYTARLHLPSRSWRFYRLGNMGELSFYQRQLQQAEIPGFCAAISALKTVEVVTVKIIEEFRPQLIARCINEHGAEFRMRFDWCDVQQLVTGLLPIFEEIAEVNATATKTTIKHKPKVLDYVQMCDLHIPNKNLILRMCSQNYSFQKAAGERTGDLSTLTSRENWQRLLRQIHEKTSHAKLWTDFTPFAESALIHPELLQKIDPHILIMRSKDSLWDQAFHLFSSLIFIKKEVAVSLN
jgi:hypothetical protein